MDEAAILQMDAETLAREIERHDRLYWDRAEPEIADPLYDLMVERLRQLRPEAEVLDRVGGAPQGTLELETAADADADAFAAWAALATGAKVAHAVPMLSLEKCYTEDELLRWFDRFEGRAAASHKVDGVAISVRYDADGRLVLGATRGNGRVGEVVTEAVKRVDGIPETIAEGPLEVRGEAFMPLSVFEADYSEDFANPRNLTAGALKQKDPTKTEQYRLRFFAYDALGLSGVGTEAEKSARLAALGFTPVPAQFADRDAAQALFETFERERAEIDFEVDGVVFKFDDLAAPGALGSTAHHPRWAIAYKYQGESGFSVLKEILWSVSRTGSVNPVAHIEPVSLSGVTVTRVSLHNLGIMEALAGGEIQIGTNADLALGAGARLLVTRRGGVIPHIESVAHPGEGAFDVPAACPSCDAPTRRDGDHLVAEHAPDCASTRLRQIEHFLKVADVDGFGPRILEQLFERDRIRTVADIFRLTVPDLAMLDRLGRKSAENLVNAVDQRRSLPLATFLAALGISDLGTTLSRKVAAAFLTLNAVRDAAPEALVAVEGVGPIVAEKFREGLADNAARIDDLLTVLDVEDAEPPAAPGEGPASGQSYVFTGALERMSRKEAQDMVRAAGGETPSAVSAATDFLVLGDGDWARFEGGWRSSKLKKAETLASKGAGLRIISETEFFELLGE